LLPNIWYDAIAKSGGAEGGRSGGGKAWCVEIGAQSPSMFPSTIMPYQTVIIRQYTTAHNNQDENLIEAAYGSLTLRLTLISIPHRHH
jgi:hypothetical protein